MTDYYIDWVNGNNANSGLTSWANAKKDVNQITASLLSNDRVKIAKTASLVSIPGNWSVTTNTCAYVGDTPLSGFQIVANGQTLAQWSSGGSSATLLADSSAYGRGAPYSKLADFSGGTLPQGIRVTLPASSTANTKYAVWNLQTDRDWSAYQEFHIWMFDYSGTWSGATAPYCDNDTFRIQLCSDAAGDTVVHEFNVYWPAYFSTRGCWLHFAPGGNLGTQIRSIVLRTGANVVSASSFAIGLGAVYLTSTSAVLRPGDALRDSAGRWTRFTYAYTVDTTPKLLTEADDQNIHIAYFPVSETGLTLQSLRNVPVTTRSANFTTTDAYSIPAFSLTAIPAAATPITIEGGWNTATDTVDGYSWLDLGLGNHTHGYAFHMSGTGNRSYTFKNFVHSSGYASAGAPYLAQTGGPLTFVFDNCHGCSGGYGTGYENLGTGVAYTITATTCTWHGRSPEFVTNGAGNVTYDTCVVFGSRGTALYSESHPGSITYTDCKLYGTYMQIANNTSYSVGSVVTLDNTQMWVRNQTNAIQAHHPGSSVTGFTVTGVSGVTNTFYLYLGNDTVLPSFSSSGSSLTVYTATTTADGNTAYEATQGKNRRTFTDWNVTDTVAFTADGGIRLKNSTISYRAASGTNLTSAGNISEFINCTIGVPAETGDTILNGTSGYRFHGCTIRRIKLQPSATANGSRPRIEAYGCAFTGNLAATSSILAGASYYLWDTFYHFCTFSQDFGTAYENNIVGNGTAGTSWYAERAYITATAYNQVATDHRIWAPRWHAKTDAATVRTAGGRSWKVTLKATAKEDSYRWFFANVAVKANKLLTAKVWVRVDADSYVVFKAEAYQLPGMTTELRDISTNQAGIWEELVLTYTPTVDGVIEFNLSFVSTATGKIVYIDDFSFEQAT